ESYSNILQRMNKRFIAYQLPSLIQNIIRSCSICQITYQKRSKTHNWKECTKPLQRGHLDIGHCSLYKSDVFVLKDSFSNFLFADWIPKQDASTIYNKLQRIFELTGAWSELVLDNQTSLAGNHMKQFLSSFRTKHTLSIVKQHNTNGAAERAIRSIKDQLYKEITLGNGKEMALRNTLTRLRCNSYKDGTPYTKFYNDSERLPNKTLELTLDIGTKEEFFSPPLDGYFQRKPDINKQWSKAKILKETLKTHILN
uniref:Integrase catalytic domain-containing protein n=1 Tax=Strongyloides papillosus TaxID=174720 RepID=A0A0N5BHA7_STREA